MARPSAATRKPEPTEDCLPAPTTRVRICRSREGAGEKMGSARPMRQRRRSWPPGAAKLAVSRADSSPKNPARGGEQTWTSIGHPAQIGKTWRNVARRRQSPALSDAECGNRADNEKGPG